jgi:hypothetical protein
MGSPPGARRILHTTSRRRPRGGPLPRARSVKPSTDTHSGFVVGERTRRERRDASQSSQPELTSTIHSARPGSKSPSDGGRLRLVSPVPQVTSRHWPPAPPDPPPPALDVVIPLVSPPAPPAPPRSARAARSAAAADPLHGAAVHGAAHRAERRRQAQKQRRGRARHRSVRLPQDSAAVRTMRLRRLDMAVAGRARDQLLKRGHGRSWSPLSARGVKRVTPRS